MLPDARVQRLKRKMDQLSYTCTDEWLVACLDWLKENFTANGTTMTEDYLLDQLKTHWLEANLEQMESECLPLGLADQKLLVLPGTYGLQINSLLDIGESAYSQYSKIKKVESENTDVEATDSTEPVKLASWQPRPRRCLQLTLTDGTQKIFGMEVESIPCLSITEIQPGAKILIKGPVDCRRGLLHLKSQHVTFLGGEAEALAENSVEGVLSRILGAENVHSINSQATQRIDLPNAQSNQAGNTNFNAIPAIQVVDLDGFDEDDDLFLEIDERNFSQ